jgi:hypothetical protein
MLLYVMCLAAWYVCNTVWKNCLRSVNTGAIYKRKCMKRGWLLDVEDGGATLLRDILSIRQLTRNNILFKTWTFECELVGTVFLFKSGK